MNGLRSCMRMSSDTSILSWPYSICVHCKSCEGLQASMLRGANCVCVLLRRHAIYYGDAQLATEWFHKLGYTLPYQINAADFILDLASGDVSTQKVSGAESKQHLIACAESFLSVSVQWLLHCCCTAATCHCLCGHLPSSVYVSATGCIAAACAVLIAVQKQHKVF